jgi:phenylalanyl-tRNA synthetase beta chain
VDCTGTSPEAVLQAVNIVCASLAERGGKIERITVNGKPYAIMEERRWPLPVKGSERLLGIPFTPVQVADFLSKMGYMIEGEHAFAPGYRADIMNEVDLIEDVAIGFGFNNFEPRLPPFVTYGRAGHESPFHEILVGLGFDEAVSWTLSNREKEAKAKLPEGERADIENPITEEFSSFRTALLPNILSILAESKNEKLPIKLYEIGPVAAPALQTRLCMASMHAKSSFSEIKGCVVSLIESSGRKAEVREAEFGPYLAGRCASVIVDGKECGFFGEIAPEVLVAFGLEQPVCACEIDA